MVQKALLNSAPGGLGVPNGASPEGGAAVTPPRVTQVTSRVKKLPSYIYPNIYRIMVCSVSDPPPPGPPQVTPRGQK